MDKTCVLGATGWQKTKDAFCVDEFPEMSGVRRGSDSETAESPKITILHLNVLCIFVGVSHCFSYFKSCDRFFKRCNVESK